MSPTLLTYRVNSTEYDLLKVNLIVINQENFAELKHFCLYFYCQLADQF